ncbi:sensor histidine kinase [Georgenia sp. AZ-5]|uniref:sensor histidine kinase n=1 Tax=Georgenia sp. AZ-5 TaxID=3367526 RepID=UPI00375455FD
MEEIWPLVGVALLGMLVGLLGAVVLAARRRRRAGAEADDDPQDDVVSVLSVLPQSVVVLEPDDDVLRASASAYTFGLVRHDRLAHEKVRRMVADLRRDGEIRDAELTLPRGPVEGAGTLRMQVRVAPLEAGRVLVLADDRTAARRVEEIRRDFVANVSHELKTPVGALALLAETVGDSADDPDTVRRFAGRMRKESRRLAELVQQIIELSRLQEADALVEPELVAIDAVVAEAVDRVRVEAQSRAVNLVLGGVKGLEVYGDAALLTTAVRNLLDNAIRYAPPRSRVSVGVSRRDGLVRVAVVDQGPGIPEDQVDRVFERFYRLDEARSRETGGSGLGLSIVKHVAADHGGRVEVWSTVGKGSTFTLVLPEADGVETTEDAPETPAVAHAQAPAAGGLEGAPEAADDRQAPPVQRDTERTATAPLPRRSMEETR